ncbi:unnamed protein product, partial [Amoebophrya sp. A25]
QDDSRQTIAEVCGSIKSPSHTSVDANSNLSFSGVVDEDDHAALDARRRSGQDRVQDEDYVVADVAHTSRPPPPGLEGFDCDDFPPELGFGALSLNDSDECGSGRSSTTKRVDEMKVSSSGSVRSSFLTKKDQVVEVSPSSASQPR